MAEKGGIINNRYALLELIGRGGSSEVWKAKHIHLDKLVAVKLLKEKLTNEEQSYSRFKQEAQIASSLIHENICSVSDFGFAEEGRVFLVMDYLKKEVQNRYSGSLDCRRCRGGCPVGFSLLERGRGRGGRRLECKRRPR